jgi:thiol peroxidase
MAIKTKQTVTMQGKSLTLEGNEVKIADKAPRFTLTDNNMNNVTMEDFAGKTLVILTLPSLDTSTCDAEARRFNTEAAKMSGDIKILAVSMDLPFAQKRWCAQAGIDKVKTLSDYKTGQFAKDYGLLIKELRLIARAVLILDKNHKVRYIQLVDEVSREPDYEEVLKALAEITK